MFINYIYYYFIECVWHINKVPRAITYTSNALHLLRIPRPCHEDTGVYLPYFLIKYAAWYSFAKPITYYGLTTIHCMIDCIICPALAPILINTYRTPSYMFVDGEYILSKEGTTQGDPLAMAMYAYGTLPLIQKLDNTAFQVWYADDSTASASLSRLQSWWKALQELGPSYGYFPNSLKTKLVIKEMHSEDACQLFEGTEIT